MKRKNRQKTLSAVVAALNALNSTAPVALPLAIEANRHNLPERSVFDFLALRDQRGGQILNSLLFTTAWAGTTTDVSAGQDSSGVTLDNGDTQNVKGGTANNVTISSGGTQNVSNGGTAFYATISSGGVQNVSIGGNAFQASILSGGMQNITDGLANHVIIGNGGVQNVSGGNVNYATVANGGVQNVSGGSASYSHIDNGGVQNVSSGDASNATINNGGVQTVSGGSANGAIISSGGVQNVSIGATADNATISSGGIQFVVGGIADGATISSGGSQNVFNGIASYAQIGNGGVQNVNGGDAHHATLNGGVQNVFGGDASGAIINNGGVQNVSGGNADTAHINSGGRQCIYSGGTATDSQVQGGGLLRINAGGSAINATLETGYVLQADTDATLTTSVGGPTISSGTASNITLNSGGILDVLTGGSALGTIISRGGIENVSGDASGATINNGGVQNVSSGGNVSGATISSGGTQSVSSGGLATGSIVQSGGVQNVSSGGVATGATISSGGTQSVNFGGSASLSTIKSGGSQTVASGGIVTNTQIDSGGVQTVATGGIVDGVVVNSGGTQTISRGGLLQLEATTPIAGTVIVQGGTIALNGDSGNYSISTLAADQGIIQLAYGVTAGRNLTLGALSGSASFLINTNLAAGTSDKIIIQNGASQNTVKVNYDPGFASGKTINGSAVFASVPNNHTSFTAQDTEFGAYHYTPSLAVSADGKTWSITSLRVTGASQTVKNAAGMAAGSLNLWQRETNSLSKRLGDLRNHTDAAGEWARIYRGSQTLAGVSQQYTAFQWGWDKRQTTKGGVWFTGWTAGYMGADLSMSRGSGASSSVTVGAYKTWLGDKGHYLDLIAKTGHLRNSYGSYLNDAANTKVNGSYTQWGSSLSAEYGYRKQLNKNHWYLEPQAEIAAGRVTDADYAASDNTHVHNAAVTTLTGRLGFALGQASQGRSFYVKASMVREFCATPSVTTSSNGLAPVTTEQNLKRSWLEYAVGWTTKLGKTSSAYLELNKTTSDSKGSSWMANLGIRMKF
ncbi:autotransporter outer membrane beta-barrel domain-containing protein [Anaeroarcus burkinensis]|uniref:autotransporter outer membrane beta-barrel domain-containing protein n=1 Tax=Anaeroarcus burkinensis TaxID=82376 RepID=UPI000429F23D|nr:autotransporter outer membrane beta-barrel domain-containing protein [Anaeroarcus burkinensis]